MHFLWEADFWKNPWNLIFSEYWKPWNCAKPRHYTRCNNQNKRANHLTYGAPSILLGFQPIFAIPDNTMWSLPFSMQTMQFSNDLAYLPTRRLKNNRLKLPSDLHRRTFDDHCNFYPSCSPRSHLAHLNALLLGHHTPSILLVTQCQETPLEAKDSP